MFLFNRLKLAPCVLAASWWTVTNETKDFQAGHRVHQTVSSPPADISLPPLFPSSASLPPSLSLPPSFHLPPSPCFSGLRHSAVFWDSREEGAGSRQHGGPLLDDLVFGKVSHKPREGGMSSQPTSANLISHRRLGSTADMLGGGHKHTHTLTHTHMLAHTHSHCKQTHGRSKAITAPG